MGDSQEDGCIMTYFWAYIIETSHKKSFHSGAISILNMFEIVRMHTLVVRCAFAFALFLLELNTKRKVDAHNFS